MALFNFVRLQMGSGWLSGHVGISEYYSWPGKKGGDRILLNPDTDSYEAFSLEIDRMIAELNEVRVKARKAFAADRKKELDRIHLNAR